jgi:hypothetical protein
MRRQLGVPRASAACARGEVRRPRRLAATIAPTCALLPLGWRTRSRDASFSATGGPGGRATPAASSCRPADPELGAPRHALDRRRIAEGSVRAALLSRDACRVQRRLGGSATTHLPHRPSSSGPRSASASARSRPPRARSARSRCGTRCAGDAALLRCRSTSRSFCLLLFVTTVVFTGLVLSAVLGQLDRRWKSCATAAAASSCG